MDVKKFKVWNSDRARRLLGEAVVQVDQGSWTWGTCTTETCRHFSHDPKMEGDVIHVACEPLAKDADGDWHYITPSGIVFGYRYASDGGQHYRPTATVWLGKITFWEKVREEARRELARIRGEEG